MAEASEMSTMGTERQWMTGSTEKTEAGTGEGDSSRRYILLIGVAFVCLIAAILLLFVIAIFFEIFPSGGRDKGGDEHESSDDNLPPILIRTDVFTKPKVETSTSMSSSWSAAATTPMKGTTTSPETRSFLFCTVGAGLEDPDVIEKGWCDYIVYSELTASGNMLLPTSSDRSWDMFKAAVRRSNTSRGGVSFTAADQDASTGTISRISEFRQEIRGFVNDGLLALGVLNLTFSVQQTTVRTTLGRVFSELKNRLGTRNGAMTFLGVRLTRHTQTQMFLNAIPTVATVDIIIFQTHMADPVSDKSGCRTLLLSVQLETQRGTQPALEVAYSAVHNLRQDKPDQAARIRTLFSVTFGVMVYSGVAGGENFRGSDQECSYGELRGHDELCKDEVRMATSLYSQRDTAEYALYSDNGVPYFVALETTRSLQAKVDRYAKTFNVSQGWAVFDVHLDENKKCGDPASFERLSFINSRLKT